MWTIVQDILQCFACRINQIYAEYHAWAPWILYSLLAPFLGPVILMGVWYVQCLYFHVYRYNRRWVPYEPDFWDELLRRLSLFWSRFSKICFGHVYHGMEHLPDKGPALIIYYHGTVPIDWFCALGELFLKKERPLYSIVDKFVFRLPGWRLMLEATYSTSGSREECIDILKKGNILAVAPGGVREALFGDEYYELIWGSRSGFAKMALEAQVPVIPMFTRNIREAFRTPVLARKMFRWLYEKYRLPLLVPTYGFFPVKLRTYFGPPIIPDSNMSAEELAQKVKDGVEQLIREHQVIPGSIIRALLERFDP